MIHHIQADSLEPVIGADARQIAQRLEPVTVAVADDARCPMPDAGQIASSRCPWQVVAGARRWADHREPVTVAQCWADRPAP